MKMFQLRQESSVLTLITDAQYELADDRSEILHTLVWIVPAGKASLRVHTQLQHSHAKAVRSILILALPGSYPQLDARMSIASGLHDVEGRLSVQVLLFDDATITGMPALTVASDDVRASHGMSVERFRKADTFYLTSRWLPQSVVDRSLILARIQSLFTALSDEDRQRLEETVMSAIEERKQQAW